MDIAGHVNFKKAIVFSLLKNIKVDKFMGLEVSIPGYWERHGRKLLERLGIRFSHLLSL